MPNADLEPRVAAVRRFNRFYTQRLGMLQENWLDSPFSLAEARVLYELANRDKPTASELAKELGLDAGYLSRILRGFAARGLIVKQASGSDGRQRLLSITARGRRQFAPLDAHSNRQVRAMLAALPEAGQARLSGAMRTIERLLGGDAARAEPYILRPPRPGDMGWIVSRHGALYGADYGWDERLEALTAEIVAEFIRTFDPKRERCWIAERDGENVGSVFLVKETERVARLRLLLVEPQARGLGIGARLVDECVRFARTAGYRKITLWTHTVLTAARRIYRNAGFKLVHKEPHDSFGRRLMGETWEFDLRQPGV
jgi:DNA-binding MarR family transcriptional regulator/N-acetylglutamate synthase-like GNAT family acetyltransferase